MVKFLAIRKSHGFGSQPNKTRQWRRRIISGAKIDFKCVIWVSDIKLTYLTLQSTTKTKNYLILKLQASTVKVKKVESSKVDTVFFGRVIRPNFILDIKTDKKVGNF